MIDGLLSINRVGHNHRLIGNGSKILFTSYCHWVSKTKDDAIRLDEFVKKIQPMQNYNLSNNCLEKFISKHLFVKCLLFWDNFGNFCLVSILEAIK